jgi:hypothetical protein
MIRPAFPLAALAGLFSGLILADAADPIRVEANRDAWLSSYPKEDEGNNGGSGKLKLKGNQEFFLIDFDAAKFKGRRVAKAQLALHLEGNETLGRLTVSSIAAAWTEGNGTGYARVPGASSFRWAKTDTARWDSAGGDLTSVILGQNGSLWGFGDCSAPDANRWQKVEVSPTVVQARLDGHSHGFFVMDDVGSEYARKGDGIDYRLFPNRYVTSREGPKKFAPYFLLWLDDQPHASQPPAPLATGARAHAPANLPPLPAPSAPAATLKAYDDLGLPLPSLELFAARGEAVTMLLELAPEKVEIDLPLRRYDTPAVGPHIDPVVPSDRGRLLEFQIPKDAKPGRHTGILRVDGKSVPFGVTVWNFALPDQLSFIAEMNGYGLPNHAREFYRLAHEHRLTLNVLPYGWTGKVSDGPRALPGGGFDWSRWDAEHGPLLDGSAFADLPRGRVPIETLYLPLNENWPMNHEQAFKGGYWIERAYDEAYWKEFRSAAQAYARHFAERRWNETVAEFFLNNKVYFKQQRGRWDACSAPWIFDEPLHTQDFWALRRFGLEFLQATAGIPGPRMSFRIDVSRPEWQRDLLDGVTGVEVVSGALRPYRTRVIAAARRDGKLIYMYGSPSKLGGSRASDIAWCAETWALGADGVVPWQTIGQKSSWSKPDDLALLYPTETGAAGSLRLKAYRAGQQLAEYLTIYAAASGQPRAAVGESVLALPGMRGKTTKANADDAGDSLFGATAAESLRDLRLRLGAWLDRQAPGDRLRWYEPRPKTQDPTKVREMVPLPAPQQ